MHGIPTWSVAPRGAPSGVEGWAGSGVSEPEVARETASLDPLWRATRILAEAEASLTAATRNAGFGFGEGSGSVAVGSFPFPLWVPTAAVSRETDNVFALGESPGFPALDFLGTIFLRVDGEVADAVDRRDAFEDDFCAGLVLSLVVSGSGGTAFFSFAAVFALIEVADVRLGLLVPVGVTDLVAVVLTLTVETVDETELRRGRDGTSAGNSDLVLLNVDDASLR
jgi:hypothetical protein